MPWLFRMAQYAQCRPLRHRLAKPCHQMCSNGVDIEGRKKKPLGSDGFKFNMDGKFEEKVMTFQPVFKSEMSKWS